MRKIYKVAEREFIETVKTRTFLLGLVFVPALIIGLILFSDRLAPRKGGPRAPVRVGVTSSSDELSGKVEALFGAYNESHPQSLITLTFLAAGEESAEERGKEELRPRPPGYLCDVRWRPGGRGGHYTLLDVQAEAFTCGHALDGGESAA
jgi:ABC-type Na+ efflux pump permease subunit